MEYNINDLEIKQDSIFYKLQPGNNTIRIVSMFVPEGVVFPDGKETIKYNCWIIDRSDEKIRLASLAKSIVLQLKDLAQTADYAFVEMPPYDITVNKTGAGMETRYKVIAARQNKDLTPTELENIKAVGSLQEFLAKKRNKAPSASVPTPEPRENPLMNF